MRGLAFALNDIGLAVFTTLAPAAAFAYVALALLALLGRMRPRERACLESWLILPLALATVGLIASATHLGNPGNALYVFRWVGRSPLSTEVLTAVVFLGVACSYWLACIYIKGMRVLRALWLLASVAAALAFVWGTTRAYAMSTVITWDTAFSMANLPLTGIAGCAPLACLVLVCAGQAYARPRLARALAALSCAGAVAACVSMLLQNAELAEMRNGFGTAASLAPGYAAAIACFGICTLLASAAALAVLRRFRLSCRDEAGEIAFDRNSPAERRAIAWLVACTLLAYCGVFAVRFAFYCFHMTAGVV